MFYLFPATSILMTIRIRIVRIIIGMIFDCCCFLHEFTTLNW